MPSAEDISLEDAADIAQALEDERRALESVREERAIEEAKLASVQRELSTYREATLAEVEHKTAEAQQGIEKSRKAVIHREQAVSRASEAIKADRKKIKQAKAALKQEAAALTRDQATVARNLKESTAMRKEAEAELEDLLVTKKLLVKERAAARKVLGEVEKSRRVIDKILREAKAKTAAANSRLIAWEQELTARERLAKQAQDTVERRWVQLRSQEAALKSAIREMKLQGKV